jgi:hypothetical protein
MNVDCAFGMARLRGLSRTLTPLLLASTAHSCDHRPGEIHAASTRSASPTALKSPVTNTECAGGTEAHIPATKPRALRGREGRGGKD